LVFTSFLSCLHARPYNATSPPNGRVETEHDLSMTYVYEKAEKVTSGHFSGVVKHELEIFRADLGLEGHNL